MEVIKQILTRPLLIIALIIQCAFLVFILTSVPKENGQLRAALSSLRTPSQSNIAPITQNEARDLRVLLEELINGHKSCTMVSAMFGFVSIALMIGMIVPLGVKQAGQATELEGRLRL